MATIQLIAVYLWAAFRRTFAPMPVRIVMYSPVLRSSRIFATNPTELVALAYGEAARDDYTEYVSIGFRDDNEELTGGILVPPKHIEQPTEYARQRRVQMLERRMRELNWYGYQPA